jgi:hypothetical protein
MQFPHKQAEPGAKLGMGSPQEGHTGGNIFKAPAVFLQSVQTPRSTLRATGAEQIRHVSGKNRFSRLSTIPWMQAVIKFRLVSEGVF